MAAFGRLFCYLDPQILRGFRISAPPRGGVFGCRGVRGEGHISGSAICRGLMCEWGLAHRRGAWLAWVGVWLVCLYCWRSVWWLLAYVRAVAGTFGTSERELAHWLDGWIHWHGGRQHWHGTVRCQGVQQVAIGWIVGGCPKNTEMSAVEHRCDGLCAASGVRSGVLLENGS